MDILINLIINYFVNDINSLIKVIIPIFDYFNLNSSKYLFFKKAVLLVNSFIRWR